MVAALGIGRTYREGVPIAATLGFWVVLSWIGNTGGLETSLRLAGIVMTLLYVGARGTTLARSRPATPQPTHVAGVLRENVHVLVSAGGWFLAAVLVALLEPYWETAGLPGLFASPVESLVFVLSATGVGTVVLYAIAVGTPRFRDGGADPDCSDAAPHSTERRETDRTAIEDG